MQLNSTKGNHLNGEGVEILGKGEDSNKSAPVFRRLLRLVKTFSHMTDPTNLYLIRNGFQGERF